MSTVEIIVVLLGLYGGYWTISHLLSMKLETKRQTAAEKNLSKECSALPWYTILKVAPDSTVEEIQHNYKRLMSQYHPDKVASLGEELKALAEHKSQEIVGAYCSAMKIHGVSNDA